MSQRQSVFTDATMVSATMVDTNPLRLIAETRTNGCHRLLVNHDVAISSEREWDKRFLIGVGTFYDGLL